MNTTLPFPVAEPDERGPLMDAQDIATELLHDKVSPAWVRENIRYKRYLGRKAVWYREEARRAVHEYLKARGVA